MQGWIENPDHFRNKAASSMVIPLDMNCSIRNSLVDKISKIFPNSFEIVKLLCQLDEIAPEEIYISQTGRLVNPRFLMFLMLGPDSNTRYSLASVSRCLERCVLAARKRRIESISIPVKLIASQGLDQGLVESLAKRIFAKESNTRLLMDYSPYRSDIDALDDYSRQTKTERARKKESQLPTPFDISGDQSRYLA